MADATPALTGFPAVRLTSANDGPPAPITVLTRRLAAGDEAAFREFHALYFDRLYRFLLVVARGDVSAAQDALQETLLRVVRHARPFDDEEIFWGWLKGIARNVARDGSRRHRRYRAVLERFTFWRSAVDSLGGARDEEELRGLLRESLAELTEEDRQLIEGKYLRGDAVVELATNAGLTEKAVESRLGRLRHRLAETLLAKLRAR